MGPGVGPNLDLHATYGLVGGRRISICRDLGVFFDWIDRQLQRHGLLLPINSFTKAPVYAASPP